MSRRGLHFIFGLVVLCLTIAAVSQWRLIAEGELVNAALDRIPSAAPAANPAPADLRHLEVKLTWANALSAHGRFAEAETAFNELIQQQSNPAIAHAAQYNLANAYLREGSRDDLAAERKRALLELAKQRYRDLLRKMPGDWDARFNLQSALRLAPEDDELETADKGNPIKQVDVIVPGFAIEDLP